MGHILPVPAHLLLICAALFLQAPTRGPHHSASRIRHARASPGNFSDARALVAGPSLVLARTTDLCAWRHWRVGPVWLGRLSPFLHAPWTESARSSPPGSPTGRCGPAPWRISSGPLAEKHPVEDFPSPRPSVPMPCPPTTTPKHGGYTVGAKPRFAANG